MIGSARRSVSSPTAITERTGGRVLLTLFIVGAVVWSFIAVAPSDGMFHAGGLSAVGEIVSDLFMPDLSPGFLRTVLGDSWRTIAFAITGMTVAVLIGLPSGALASGVLMRPSRFNVALTVVARAYLGILRAVHELVWAVLFVAAFGLSPAAGVLAIGIPYGGIVGRILAERLQDVPDEPLDALRLAGASELPVLAFARAPMVAADVVSYLFYRLECAVRAAVVLSFAGLGGLGFRITIALDDLRFDQAWTAVFAIVVIIIIIDIWSSQVRKRLIH